MSGHGHAIVAARPGCSIALRRSPPSAAILKSAAERFKTARDQVSGTFMPQKVRIALDAMGGDVGASVVIPGAAISLTRHPDSEFLLFGDRALIEAQLAKYPAMKPASRIIHTDVAVSMHDKPSQALRRGRKTSSMWLAIDAVKKGEADVAVSAGNTGALMAMARFHLHMLRGIDRPAIAAVWPTMRGDSVVLDLGATIGGDAHHLMALAVMGSAMASVLFDLERPTVGLLNIGVEEMKGGEEIRKAAELLRAMNLPQLEYIGFVEGDGIGKGAADVIVTEGFSGNMRGRFRNICAAPWRAPGARASAISSPAMLSRRCVTRWIPTNPMAACCSASTASWSRAMVEPTPKALRMRSMLAMRWSTTIS